MEAASIAQHCKYLHLSSIAAQFASLAEEARQQNHSHLGYLEALLQGEVEDRERRSIELRIKDAHLPRMKTLEEFDFAQSPQIPASRIRALAEGGYLERAEPVLLVGEPGTGKTHLATGLAIAACRQRRRVRFTTAAALVNQLVEAQREQSLSRMLKRWASVELIVIDELGYVPLAEVAAELLFQVIADRAEKAAVIVTTNLPFSEWPQVFTNARLCKAYSIGSPTRPTSSRLAPSPTGSAEHWGRSEKCNPWRRRRSVLLPLRPAGYAPAEPNSTLLNTTFQGWARLNGRSGPEQLAKRSCIQLPFISGKLIFISGKRTAHRRKQRLRQLRFQLFEKVGAETRTVALSGHRRRLSGLTHDAYFLTEMSSMQSIYAVFMRCFVTHLIPLGALARYHFRGSVCVRSMPPKSSASSS